MLRVVNPDNAILPVLRVDPEGHVKEVLGAAFFFSERPLILSARHVLKVEPGPGEAIVVPSRRPPDAEPGVAKPLPQMALLQNVRACPDYDLAVAEVPDVTHFEYLPIRHDEPAANVRTYDLVSQETLEATAPGKPPARTLNPYVWKGYVHHVIVTQEFALGMHAPGKIIEVSIPVAKGMSGAPLVDEATLRVVGVVLGNRTRPLVPAPQAASEEQQWYLPIGRALHWSHVREFLESIGEAAP